MWTAIIIAGLAAAMMLGPIMMMQPSKRQRRLAKVRSAAEARGLKIRMAAMPDKSVRAGEEIAVYCYPWPGEKPIKQTWVLARQPFAHGLHFEAEWDWASGSKAVQQWQEVLKDALTDAPPGVLALEYSGHALGAYWTEQVGDLSPEQATAAIADWLQALSDRLLLARPAVPAADY